MGEPKRYDITSADSTTIGFDYQFFYFVKAVLLLQRGQAVGYETKDDVHITFPKGELLLVQLKHTMQQSLTTSKTINLTELDDDLTKSLYNWALVICDASEGRSLFAEQLSFVKNTRFILATNKQIDSNSFIDNIIKVQNKKIEIQVLKAYIENLISKSKNIETKKHLNALLSLNAQVFEEFVLRIKFENQVSEISNEIKELIANKFIRESRINDVFNAVFSELKLAHVNEVLQNRKLVITYDNWHKKLTAIFENYRSTNLKPRKLDIVLPQKLEDQPFIKELVEIGDMAQSEIAQIAEFTTFMLEIEMNLKSWYDDGEITQEELYDLKKEAILFWENTHRASHRTSNDSNLEVANALKCLDNIRIKKLTLQETLLTDKLSNGKFYKLANEGEIGWLKKWESKYKK